MEYKLNWIAAEERVPRVQPLQVQVYYFRQLFRLEPSRPRRTGVRRQGIIKSKITLAACRFRQQRGLLLGVSFPPCCESICIAALRRQQPEPAPPAQPATLGSHLSGSEGRQTSEAWKVELSPLMRKMNNTAEATRENRNVDGNLGSTSSDVQSFQN